MQHLREQQVQAPDATATVADQPVKTTKSALDIMAPDAAKAFTGSEPMKGPQTTKTVGQVTPVTGSSAESGDANPMVSAKTQVDPLLWPSHSGTNFVRYARADMTAFVCRPLHTSAYNC